MIFSFLGITNPDALWTWAIVMVLIFVPLGIMYWPRIRPRVLKAIGRDRESLRTRIGSHYRDKSDQVKDEIPVQDRNLILTGDWPRGEKFKSWNEKLS